MCDDNLAKRLIRMMDQQIHWMHQPAYLGLHVCCMAIVSTIYIYIDMSLRKLRMSMLCLLTSMSSRRISI